MGRPSKSSTGTRRTLIAAGSFTPAEERTASAHSAGGASADRPLEFPRQVYNVGLVLDGRSDHSPFIAAGTPAGGARPCYHQAYDTPSDVNATNAKGHRRSLQGLTSC
ncbi:MULTISPECIES: M28 family peptidase [Streptomyces]|uniref:M28 family peptidase n=1 Tax=Streptomyces flaveolus TaxID=67297 RepID=A0ABV3AIZ0_9ACTN|nr:MULTISPECIES: M28 family peptidase [Streptomyces]